MEKVTRPNVPLPRQPRYGWQHGEMPEQTLGHTGGSGARGAFPEPSKSMARSMAGAVLYQKSIDNSAVWYWHDPSDRFSLRRHVSWGLFVVFVVVLVSGPRLWVRHSGYRQAELAQDIDDLVGVRDRMKVRKGRLEDPSRVAALAEDRGFHETEEDSYVWSALPLSEEGLETEVAQLVVTED